MQTLEKYLRENYAQGLIDHAIRATVNADGDVTFYIHPHGANGDTLDFMAKENNLIEMQEE